MLFEGLVIFKLWVCVLCDVVLYIEICEKYLFYVDYCLNKDVVVKVLLVVLGVF